MRGALSARICVLERGRNQHVAGQLERVGRRRDVGRAREVQDRAGLAAVGDHRFQIEAVGFGDGAFVFGQAHQDRAALLAELRDVVADVAQALHDDALAGQAGSEPERAHVVVDGAHFAQREVEPAARGFAPAADAALADGLARHARQRVEPVGRHRLVGVDDPRHLALARAVVRRRHVHARTDEVLLDQLVRVPPRHAFELVERQLRGSTWTAPLAPPNGTSTIAHFQVISDASAITSSSLTSAL